MCPTSFDANPRNYRVLHITSRYADELASRVHAGRRSVISKLVTDGDTLYIFDLVRYLVLVDCDRGSVTVRCQPSRAPNIGC